MMQDEHTIQIIHIKYINYLIHIEKYPKDNFWGIKTFRDYILRFYSEAHLDTAIHVGYNVKQ